MQPRKIPFGSKELTCKLDGQAIVDFEQMAKKNPIKLFMTTGMQMDFPRVGELLTIIHCAASRLTHGLKIADMPTLFDEYCESGGDYMQLLEFVQQLVEDAGFFGKKEQQEAEPRSGSNNLIEMPTEANMPNPESLL
ncbi:DUF6096 family protein [Enterococcus sp.]|uniref:DUF6096 family protein n=1 Tax=Enterococcus sp. TaxID=35783 RepID=UPI00289C3CE5|nr:DUF6096 family protein [Enterococcus sp.]